MLLHCARRLLIFKLIRAPVADNCARSDQFCRGETTSGVAVGHPCVCVCVCVVCCYVRISDDDEEDSMSISSLSEEY